MAISIAFQTTYFQTTAVIPIQILILSKPFSGRKLKALKSSCTAIYLRSRVPSNKGEQNMLDTALEVRVN